VWVGNFGGNSLTELRPDGAPISPDATGYGTDGGYHHRRFDEPQSLLVTEDGSIWVTNLGGDSVSQLVGGDPNDIRDWGGDDCAHRFVGPWGLASDADGTVFVTNTEGRSVIAIDPALPRDLHCPVAEYPVDDLALPQGIATDMAGNLWVADTYGLGRVTFLDASNGYAATSFTAGGTSVGPWGIAVDGDDNVWVADFFGKRILHLCGASGNCPEGRTALGSRLSPAGVAASGEPGNGGGYGANGSLQSITSINIDQAGNVWVANNFDDVPVCLLGAGIPDPAEGGSTVELERLQTECGGNGVVVMFGVAAPVAAPSFGVPQRP
jgi:sugar lactone lactonase YvrE